MRADPWGRFGIDDPPRIDPWIRRKSRVCACEGCDTVLSMYNSSTNCWLHDTMRVYAMPGPQQRSRARIGRPDAAHPFG